MIGIVDYGTSNVGSLMNGLNRIGVPYTLSADPTELGRCDRLILPGVGAFGHAMNQLRVRSLDAFLIEAATSGLPILGICLGMQLLMESSEEHGQHKGLGIVKGNVVALKSGRRKVHMGWNSISATADDSFLGADNYGYFVHSYHCRPTDEGTIAGTTDYGSVVVAALQQNNLWGVQFHPEKSGEYGLSILRRFADESF